MFELKVMEPAAFKFDYIATQTGQSSAGMPENGCRTRRREEAESFSKKLMKVTQCCVAAPRNTTRYTTRNTTELLAGAAFGALMLLRNEMKIQDDFSVLARNAAPGSISAVLRVV